MTRLIQCDTLGFYQVMGDHCVAGVARFFKETDMSRNIGSGGSNEKDWIKYQQEPAKSLKKARLVQSGVDPEESFNFVRGGILVGCIIAVIGCICWVLL